MHLLYVEDNPADVALFQYVLQEVTTQVKVSVVPDGQAALDFLYRHAPYTTAAAPDLVLLDLNMPRKDGYAVLTELKHHPQLKRIPIVVFTSTTQASEVARCYELGANAFLAKALDLEQYLALVRSLVQFWSVCLLGVRGE